ncbi:MAG TPA: MFS transporter [Thermoleophilaceae bacterium]
MTERETRTAVLALLLATLVAVLSSTVVATALPEIVTGLRGTQAVYTWVVVATLLTVTASTPVWGKLADRTDRALLLQISLVIYAVASLAAGLAASSGALIACRAVQGVGVGGMTGLVQVILTDLVPPRELGRYSGHLGAMFAVGTITGPLLGGAVAETLGWRWCFLLGVPIASAVSVVLARTLRLPERRSRVPAGGRFRDGLVPRRLLADRTLVIASLASIAVGAALFGLTVLVPQYMQVARAKSPAESALLALPMFAALVAAATATGRAIVRTGRYKRRLLGGTAMLAAGAAAMALVSDTTSLVFVCGCLMAMGAGVGALIHSLTLVAQNAAERRDTGAATALVSFSRGIGGAAGLCVLGALVAHGARFGEAIVALTPAVLAALLALSALPEVPLGGRSGIELRRDDEFPARTGSQ